MDSAIMELTTQAGLGHQVRSWKVGGRGPESAGSMVGAGSGQEPMWRKDSCFVNKVLLEHSQAHSCVLQPRPLPSHKSRAERF